MTDDGLPEDDYVVGPGRAGRVAHSRRLIVAGVWANYGTRRRPAVTLTLPSPSIRARSTSLAGARTGADSGRAIFETEPIGSPLKTRIPEESRR
jgi:hypothetical protein